MTAPNGKSARRASSIAMRMNVTSSAVGGPANWALAAIGKMVVQASPAMKQRRLASPTWGQSH
jgi:hypothetical protein